MSNKHINIFYSFSDSLKTEDKKKLTHFSIALKTKIEEFSGQSVRVILDSSSVEWRKLWPYVFEPYAQANNFLLCLISKEYLLHSETCTEILKFYKQAGSNHLYFANYSGFSTNKAASKEMLQLIGRSKIYDWRSIKLHASDDNKNILLTSKYYDFIKSKLVESYDTGLELDQLSNIDPETLLINAEEELKQLNKASTKVRMQNSLVKEYKEDEFNISCTNLDQADNIASSELQSRSVLMSADIVKDKDEDKDDAKKSNGIESKIVNRSKDIEIPEGLPEIIVAQGGGGDMRSIAKAVASCPDNTPTVIRIKPGKYFKSIEITNKEVYLIGDKDTLDDNLLVIRNNSAIKASNSKVFVQNLTIKHGGNDYIYGIDLENCEFDMRSCNITSECSSCISSHGTTTGIVCHCNINDCQDGSGIFICESSSFDIHNNIISHNARAGIEIKDKSYANIYFNKIINGYGGGVLVHSGGMADIHQNDINYNELAGIQVEGKDVTPNILGNRISFGKQSGIYFMSGSSGKVENNDISNNAYAGITVTTESSPNIIDNRINNNSYCGIWLHACAQTLLRGNDLTNNNSGSWLISKGTVMPIDENNKE